MLPSLVVSALFILLTLVLAHGARRLVDRAIKDPFVRLLLLESIAAAELCGCCFELIIGEHCTESLSADTILNLLNSGTNSVMMNNEK
jgi:hypothetical protein